MELVRLKQTKTTFGIDKVRLHTRDFHLEKLDLSKGWMAHPASIKHDYTPEVWNVTGEGRELTEKKWFNNSGEAKIEVSNQGLSVHYNPSTLDHDFELTNDLERSWERVKYQLKDLGIQWNEEGAGMTRVDLTKQKVMKHPSYVYTNALGLVKGKRMGTRTYGSNAVEVKNTQRALVCYDKTLQLREMKNVTTAPDNLLRMEARWTSRKAIGQLGTGLHLTNVGELVKASTAHLEDCYNKFLTNHVFRTEGEQLTLDLVKEKDKLAYYRENYERGAFNAYVSSFGIPELIRTFGADLSLLETLLHEVYSRAHVYDLIRGLREKIDEYNLVQSLHGTTSPLAHLEHLQTTFTSRIHV